MGQRGAIRLDLTGNGSRIEKTRVGPLGSNLFDSALSVTSSPEWVLFSYPSVVNLWNPVIASLFIHNTLGIWWWIFLFFIFVGSGGWGVGQWSYFLYLRWIWLSKSYISHQTDSLKFTFLLGFILFSVLHLICILVSIIATLTEINWWCNKLLPASLICGPQWPLNPHCPLPPQTETQTQ